MERRVLNHRKPDEAECRSWRQKWRKSPEQGISLGRAPLILSWRRVNKAPALTRFLAMS
jgi:hypothetical protein